MSSSNANQNVLTPWTLQRTVGPTASPISVAQAKQHLRLSQNDSTHDDLIAAQIDSAVESIENDCELALINQTFEAIGVSFPATAAGIPLDRVPIVSITDIKYLDADGVEQTLDPADYQLDTARRMLFPAYGLAWPTVGESHRAVVITFVAGCGLTSDAMPAWALQAAYLLISRDFYGVDVQERYRDVIRGHVRTRYP